MPRNEDFGSQASESLLVPNSVKFLKHRLLSGGVWALGGRMLAALTALITSALLARLLSPQDLAAYILALSLASVGTIVGSLGMGREVVRSVAGSMSLGQPEKARQAVYSVHRIGVVGAAGAGLLYLLLGGVLGRAVFHSPALAAVTGLIAGWIFVMSQQNLLAEMFRGFHDIRYATIFSGLGPSAGILLTVSLASLWVARGEATLHTVLLLVIGSCLISALLAMLVLWRRVSTLPSPSDADGNIKHRKMALISWPLWITQIILFVLLYADLWIAGALLPEAEVALYGTAFRLMLFVVIPLQLAGMVVPPLIAELYAQRRIRELERALRATATLASIPSLLILVAFVFFGGPILGLVFGEYYREGASILVLLSLGQIVNVATGSCNETLMMTGNHAAMMIVTISSGLLLGVGALWAGQSYGAVGIAGMVAFSKAFQNLLMLLYAKRRTGMWTHVTFNLPRGLR